MPGFGGGCIESGHEFVEPALRCGGPARDQARKDFEAALSIRKRLSSSDPAQYEAKYAESLFWRRTRMPFLYHTSAKVWIVLNCYGRI